MAALTVETTRRYPCARCGRRQPASLMVFSRFSRNHYCADLGACQKRAKRLKRKDA